MIKWFRSVVAAIALIQIKVMRLVLVLLVFSLLSSAARNKKPHSTKKVLVLERAEPCSNTPKTPSVIKARIDDYGRGVTYLNMNFTVQQDPPPTLDVILKVTKCKALEESSCEYYMKAKADFCRAIQDKDQFYSPLLDFKPEVRCPLTGGSQHILKNASLPTGKLLDAIGFIPPENFNFHWAFKMYVMDGKSPHSLLFCLRVVTKTETVRS